MKKYIIIICVLILVGIVFIELKRNMDTTAFHIDIVSIVEIDPITQLRQGFRHEFETSQFAIQHHVVFTEYNAQGDSGLINQIADKVVAEKPDLVYVLGTPVAQAIQKRNPDLLVVQGAVTDPVAAGLANSWDGSGKKYIATSDLPPIVKQIDLIRSLTPNVVRLGIIYNPSEANSVAVISRFRAEIASERANLKLVERPIANTGEVATALQSLLGNIDAIYLPPDNTANAAIQVIGHFAADNKIPFYATVKNALDDGALAALSLDYFELGKESAQLALAVLQGQNPATTPIKLDENPQAFINAKVAQVFSVQLDQFRGKAGITIDE